MWHRVGLRGRLLAAFGCVALFLPLVAAVGYFTSREVFGHYDRAARIAIRDNALVSHLGALARSTAHQSVRLGAYGISNKDQAALIEAIKKVPAEFEPIEKEYRGHKLTEDEVARFVELKGKWTAVYTVSAKLAQLAAQADSTFEFNNMLAKDFERENSAFWTAWQAFADDNQKRVSVLQAEAVGVSQRGNFVSGAFAFGGFALAMVISFWFAVAFSQKLNVVAESLANCASNVSDVSSRVLEASSKLTNAAALQSSAATESSSTAHEINEMVQRNLSFSELSKSVADQTMQSVQAGKGSVEGLTQSIQRLSAGFIDLQREIDQHVSEFESVRKLIHEINGKTRVIHDIVFQTRLLSFNASVEAARAGEHGRGFSVVAEEVGNLARVSGESAAQIAAILESSHAQVDQLDTRIRERIRQLIEQKAGELSRGSREAAECQAHLEKIHNHMSDVQRMAAEVALASNEQTKGVSTISEAIDNIHLNAGTTSQIAKQSFESVQELDRHVGVLRQSVDQLKFSVDGKQTAA